MKPWRPGTDVHEFHAHVYYSPESKASALRLHEAVQSFRAVGVTIHSVADGSRGPHVPPMFGMDIPKAAFAEVLSFLILNHGPHPILIHPVTGHELMDHTHHALWLGQPQPLNLAVLE